MGPNGGRDREQAWEVFKATIQGSFPYCILSRVRVEEGVVISWEEMRQTVVFGQAGGKRQAAGGDRPDRHWGQFRAFCESKRNAVLAEVQFMDGRPVLVKLLNGPGKARGMLESGMYLNGTQGGDARGDRMAAMT